MPGKCSTTPRCGLLIWASNALAWCVAPLVFPHWCFHILTAVTDECRLRALMCLPLIHSRFNWSIALIALCCGGPTQAATVLADAGEWAQMSLDDLLHVEVQSASRYAQPLAESPASVTVIDQVELHRQSYRNLAEALASVPGVYVSNDRNYSYLGVRGFNRPGDYNSRILLLTDGARPVSYTHLRAHETDS